MFALRQKYKDEKNDLMQGLVKLIMNSLHGDQIRRVIKEFYKYKSQHWMKTEYDGNALDYWRLPNGTYMVKFEKYDALDDGNNDVKNTLPAQLGAFFSSNSKRIMNEFIREIKGFYNNSIYYGDTDSLLLEKKFWDVLDKANLVGKNLCQRKNDYDGGPFFYGLLLAPKLKYVLTINEFGVIQQHITFNGFNASYRRFDRSQYFDMLERKKISAMLPRSWKKSFNKGIVIPVKKKTM